MDAEELLLRHETWQNAGNSREEIAQRRAHARCREEVAVCRQHLRQCGLLPSGGAATALEARVRRTHDSSDGDANDIRHVILCYASALDGLGRTLDATTLLTSYLDPSSSSEEEGGEEEENDTTRDIPVMMALAKLYFKAQQYEPCMDLCMSIMEYCTHTRQQQQQQQQQQQHDDDVADAFHLAGWVCIHARDDHTQAYRIWQRGATRLPECTVLATQRNKRRCWDDDDTTEIDTLLDTTTPLCVPLSANELDCYTVPRGIPCPALALFDGTSSTRRLVVRTRRPVLSADECARVVACVDAHHANSKWGTVRHSSVVTTDVAVQDVPALRPWLRTLLQTRLYPLVHTAFGTLADGSSLLVDDDTTTATSSSSPNYRIRVHDAFVVRYDADGDKSCRLPEHSDTSLVSFTVALNQRGVDFVGGGTWFEAIGGSGSNDDSSNAAPRRGTVVEADCGCAVAFAGPLRHAGYPVTSGCRIILVLFLYAEDFPYGHLLQAYRQKHTGTAAAAAACGGDNGKDEAPPCVANQEDEPVTGVGGDCPIDVTRPSGDQPGGFVVYNQTVELVSMLNRRVASILGP